MKMYVGTILLNSGNVVAKKRYAYRRRFHAHPIFTNSWEPLSSEIRREMCFPDRTLSSFVRSDKRHERDWVGTVCSVSEQVVRLDNSISICINTQFHYYWHDDILACFPVDAYVFYMLFCFIFNVESAIVSTVSNLILFRTNLKSHSFHIVLLTLAIQQSCLRSLQDISFKTNFLV